MNAGLLAICTFALFLLGYRFYSRFLSERIFQLSDAEPVPAREFEDGVDFVPTRKHVLWGHHYTSIAGAAPIVGPAIAVIWGWLPALLWVAIGTVFMGAVHDFSALVISLRHRGRSIGDVAGDVIGARANSPSFAGSRNLNDNLLIEVIDGVAIDRGTLMFGTMVAGNGSLMIGNNNAGSGVGTAEDITALVADGAINIIKLVNGVVAPTVNPTAGGYFYVTAGALHWVGSAGTDTAIAAA